MLLSGTGDRWRHTRTVAARARLAVPAVLPTCGAAGADRLAAAAWLHDVGYAPALARHGFHPVDGAAHLRATGWPEGVVLLVAHHSGARFVAAERGLAELMDPYDDPRGWTGPEADALAWADQTAAADGSVVGVEERLAEVVARHGEGSALGRSFALRAPAVRAAAAATEARLELAAADRDTAGARATRAG